MKPKTLALDLEGTIISDAFSCFARPGAREFLDWCGQAFERVVIYTAVPEFYVRQVVDILIEDGEAPDWLAKAEIFHPVDQVGQDQKVKNLDVLGPEGTAVLVDDFEDYILESQKAWWVKVLQFTAHDGCESDRELELVKDELQRRFLR